MPQAIKCVAQYRHGIVTFIIFLLVITAYVVANNVDGQSILIIVIPMGLLGASVRDYCTFKQGNEKASKDLYEHLMMLLLGAVMAVVLTIMFATTVIEGLFFPKIVGGETPFESIKSALRDDITLATTADLYKLMLWSFIAGFSDNFVYRKLGYFVKQKNT